jgi:hypothetical protein
VSILDISSVSGTPSLLGANSEDDDRGVDAGDSSAADYENNIKHMDAFAADVVPSLPAQQPVALNPTADGSGKGSTGPVDGNGPRASPPNWLAAAHDDDLGHQLGSAIDGLQSDPQQPSSAASRTNGASLAEPTLPAGSPDVTYASVPGAQLFKGEPSPTDVKQGHLGDCYFEASLASLAQTQPDAIKQAISTNADGTYNVRLYSKAPDGQMKPNWVTVDDKLPVKEGTTTPVYGHSQDPQAIWPDIMEKAYAESKGGYGAIGNGGSTVNAMSALTGKDAQNTNTRAVSADALWSQLKASAGQDLVTANSRDEAETQNGVFGKHSYTVMATSEENGQRYVTMRNPLGHGEPVDATGAPLDGTDDGIFKMNMENFADNFACITVGQRPGAVPSLEK